MFTNSPFLHCFLLLLSLLCNLWRFGHIEALVLLLQHSRLSVLDPATGALDGTTPVHIAAANSQVRTKHCAPNV